MPPQPPAITAEDHRQRIDCLQRRMAEQNVDAVLLPGGASLRYFTGVGWGISERLLGAMIGREGDPVYVAPAFEEPKVRQLLRVGDAVRVWQEEESPYRLVAQLLSEWRAEKLAFDEATPWAFVAGIRSEAPSIELVDPVGTVAACRAVKSPAEIAIIRWAMGLTLDVHRRVHEMLRPGMTNTEIAAAADRMHREGGADGGNTFSIVAFADQTAYPHGPEGEQTLRDGDTVLVDIGCAVHGYQSDLTRTYVFGEPTERQRQLWAVEHEAQQAAFDAAKPGAPCSAVDEAARAVIAKHGFGPDYKTPGLPHRTGHGLGLECHERPYLVRGNDTPLTPGNIASIEPTLCVYGEMGVRLEDHFLVTESGAEWLTKPSESIDKPFG
ncbi:M24 family metallopeptidase [Botrimarina mediterranea]|uniref:M24 family metallopeptidase n=1 Tax=Botrimarina mediterranea TaxID=2528022 RepID=UPI003AF32188